MTHATPRKFLFERRFEEDTPTPARPVKHRFSREEVEEIEREAFARGQASEAAEADRRMAAAVETLCADALKAFGAFAELRTRMHDEACQLALTTARKLAGRLLADHPETEIMAFITDCLDLLRDEPRLTISVPADIREVIGARLEALPGSQAEAVRLGESDMAGELARIEWQGGFAEFDPQAVEREIEQLVETYLAHHADPEEVHG